MKITFAELISQNLPRTLVVHSLDQALYHVTVLIDDREVLLAEDNGKVFRRHSLQEVREILRLLPVERLSLRQQSAYDEMIGQPPRAGDNTLEVPLSIPAAGATTTRH